VRARRGVIDGVDRVAVEWCDERRSWAPSTWTPPASWRAVAGVPEVVVRPVVWGGAPGAGKTLSAMEEQWRWENLMEARQIEASLAAFREFVFRHTFSVGTAREERIRREAGALLDAGAKLSDLIIVTSPMYPQGRVMTKRQQAEHGAEMWAQLQRWVSDLDT
jgi:hypothetical protein